MKKAANLSIFVAIACLLSGCSQKKTDRTDPPGKNILLPAESAIEEERETISENGFTEQNRAYGGILWDAYYLGRIEGKQYAFPNPEGNKSGRFAIYDIDGDGYEELLLCFEGGSTASAVEYIWGYENGSTHIELCEFPKMRYYSNGVIEADWSHNQNLAGDFQPVSVYIYNSEADEYQMLGAVDAWDKTSTEGAEHFPEGGPQANHREPPCCGGRSGL